VLKWASKHGCELNERTCMRRCGRASGGASVVGGARLPMGRREVSRRRTWARGGGAVGSTCALTGTYPPAGSTPGRATTLSLLL